jgi:hypothetical protein
MTSEVESPFLNTVDITANILPALLRSLGRREISLNNIGRSRGKNGCAEHSQMY